MWPHAEKLAEKLRKMVENSSNGKPIMEDVKHKDMSESEPEEEPKEQVAPKSSFAIPKVARKPIKKKKRVKRPQEKVFIANPISYKMSDSSEDEAKKPKKKNVKVVKKGVKEESDYEDDYENDFEEPKEKNEDSDDYGVDDDFENEDGDKKEDHKEPEKEVIQKSENKKPQTSKSASTAKGNRSKYSTNKKPPSTRERQDLNATKQTHKPTKKTKISMFNARASTSNRGTRRDPQPRNRSQIKHYSNLHHSTSKKPRQRGFNTNPLSSSSVNLNSQYKLKRNRSFTKKRLGTSYKEKRRPMSARRPAKTKQQEILITKIYDLSLNIGKKSNKKISYINKDDKE